MADTSWLPWDTYPDLTLERLTATASIMMRERDDAAHDHLPEKGETEFTLGVSAWERTKFALVSASPNVPWLSIAKGSEPGPRLFIFQIGLYPIRFYHGTPDFTPPRYLLLSDEEQAAQAVLPLDNRIPEGHFLRISIETNAAHLTSGVELAEYDVLKRLVRRFSIPLVEQTSTITPFVAPQKAGVEIPAPTVKVIRRDRKQQGE